MNNFYLKQFRPLTSEDIETIRKQQGNKNIGILLEKKPIFSEKKEINFELKIMPELNCLVEGYYIFKNSFETKDNLPFIMSQEVYDMYVNREDKIANRYFTPIFMEWLNDNFNLSLFGRYELKIDPDGNQGSWTIGELYDKYDKIVYVNNSIKNNINNLKKESIMEELKCGDVVVLKSGSPKMTVGTKGVNDASVYCLWFEGAFLRTAKFPLASIENVPTSDRTKADG